MASKKAPHLSGLFYCAKNYHESMTLPTPHFELDRLGVARSKYFDDVYASTSGAFAQAEYVYVQGCDLPHRFATEGKLRILELGFGLAVNFLATARAFLQHAAHEDQLDYLGIEGFPISHLEFSVWLASLKNQLPNDLITLADELAQAWPDAEQSEVRGWHTLSLAGGRIRLTLILDDVHAALLQIPGGVDAVYLDGFSPSKNPAMWHPSVLAQVRGKLNANAYLASYSIASAPLQTLRELGLDVKKLPGFAEKRERLQARLVASTPRHATLRKARKRMAIVGGGIAGLTVAYRLLREQNASQLELTLIERERAFAGASGAPAVLLHAPTSSDSSIDFALHTLAFRHAMDALRELSLLGVDTSWQPLRIAQARKGEAGVESPFGGRLLPAVFCANVCAFLRAQYPIEWLHANVRGISGQRGEWRLELENDADLNFDEIALCTGYSTAAFVPRIGMRFVQGQIETVLPHASIQPGRLELQGFDAWCGQSVLVPTRAGQYALGNSFERTQIKLEPDVRVREQLIDTARSVLDWHAPIERMGSWHGIRAQCEARLPRIGLHQNGMHLSLAHASKGFITAFLAANWISAELANRPLNVPLTLQQRLRC